MGRGLFGLGYGCPAGGAAAWSPADLTGLVDEWDADAAYCTTDAGADLEAGSSQYLNHAGNADLRGGSTWYRCGWFKMESTGVVHTLMTTLSGNDGYEVRITSGNVLAVEVGTGSGTNTATHATTLSAGTWYFWEAQYDGTDVGIALNGGAFTTTTTAFSAGSAAFRIGSTIAGGSYADGVAQLFAAVGGNPSSGERTALYASGSPSTYADITAPANLVSWWNLHEASGARADSHGSNDLTAVNTPGVAAGVAEGTVQDRSPVKTWTGKVNGVAFSQATVSAQPIWNADYFGSGLNAIIPNGVDQALEATWTSRSAPYYRSVAVKWDSTPPSGINRFYGRHSNTQGTIISYEGGVWKTWAGAFVASAVSDTASAHVIGQLVKAGSDGETDVDGTVSTGTIGANAGPAARIGGDLSGDFQGPVAFGNIVEVDGEPTSDERSSLLAYQNGRVGL